MWNVDNHPNSLVKHLHATSAFLIEPRIEENPGVGTRLFWEHDISADFAAKLMLRDTGVEGDGKTWASGGFRVNTGLYHWHAVDFGTGGRVKVWRYIGPADFYGNVHISYRRKDGNVWAASRTVGKVVAVTPGGNLAVDYYTGKEVIDPAQVRTIDIGGELPASKEELAGFSDRSYRAG